MESGIDSLVMCPGSLESWTLHTIQSSQKCAVVFLKTRDTEKGNLKSSAAQQVINQFY